MKKFYILFLSVLFVIGLFAGTSQVSAKPKPSAVVDKALGIPIAEDKLDSLYQISTYDAYTKGYFKNNENAVTVRKYGDFGVGLLKDETGAIIYDTQNTYKAKEFKLEKLTFNEYIPVSFGIFKFFDSDDRATVKNAANITELTTKLDEKLETVNYFVAIKAKGMFKSVVLQTETNEKKTLENVKGQLIGFRIPDFYANTAPSGYTFYFISDDKSTGAKVYEANTSLVSFYIDYSDRIELILPKYKSFKVKDFSQYQPQTREKEVAKNKQPVQRDMRQIMQTNSTTEPTADDMMQMIAPKMTL